MILNVPQRIVLLIGAASVLWIADRWPGVVIAQGAVLRPTTQQSQLAVVTDVRSVGVYVAALSIATLMLFFAVASSRSGQVTTLESRVADLEKRLGASQERIARDLSVVEDHLTSPERRA